MMDNRVKIGDQFYSPLLIKVGYQQKYPDGASDLVKALSAEFEDKKMMNRLHHAVDEHVQKTAVLRGGYLYTSKVELMILKPIENGE